MAALALSASTLHWIEAKVVCITPTFVVPVQAGILLLRQIDCHGVRLSDRDEGVKPLDCPLAIAINLVDAQGVGPLGNPAPKPCGAYAKGWSLKHKADGRPCALCTGKVTMAFVVQERNFSAMATGLIDLVAPHRSVWDD